MRIRTWLGFWTALLGALTAIDAKPAAAQQPAYIDYWNRYPEANRTSCYAKGGMEPTGLYDWAKHPTMNLGGDSPFKDYQSPIKLDSNTPIDPALPEIEFRYQPTVTSGSKLALVNDGYKVELMLDPEEYQTGRPGRINGITEAPPEREIVLNGKSFALNNIHFHLPSEHVLDQQTYAMEMHIVHVVDAGRPNVRRAVVGVLLTLGDKDNAALAPIFNLMGDLKTKGDKALVTLNGQDLMKILPADRTYLGYHGSLTTPGCDFGVTWMVLKTPVAISRAQLATFQETIKYGSQGATVNARVIQFPAYHRVSPTYPKK